MPFSNILESEKTLKNFCILLDHSRKYNSIYDNSNEKYKVLGSDRRSLEAAHSDAGTSNRQ